MSLTINTPKELLSDSFPINNIYPRLQDSDSRSLIPFIYEAHYYLHLDTFIPWVNINFEKCVRERINEWKTLQLKIETLFKERNKEKKADIKLGLAYFLECLFWTNEQPVRLDRGLVFNDLDVKPFNIEDRLSFIIRRMDGYHSYRQLNELFNELEKQFSVKLLRMKLGK